MNERKAAAERRALLAFVERYWQDMTLCEALALRVEMVDARSPCGRRLNVS